MQKSTVEDVEEFLKKIPPFQFLDDKTLRSISSNVLMELHPKDSVILSQDGPPSEYLRVIKKGGVKVFVKTSKDEEIIIDYRSDGDSFGFLSLVSGDKSRANVIAAEDTVCYLIGKETILRLLDTNAAFTEFFLKSFINKFIDKTYKEMHNRGLIYSGGNKLLFTTPVGGLANKGIITASTDTSIREAAEIMSSNKISSVVLLNADGTPAGIVTDRDLRDKVVSKGRSVTDPVSSIMSISLVKADARDYCFEALLKMIKYNIHHLLVVDDGKLMGMVTNHDLMMLQGTSPISVVREIEDQHTVEGLIPVSDKINKIIGLLLKEGARASNITRIITEINDRLVRKLLEITERRLGPPPVSYCWIVFGSEGRQEQTFKTDQDNAIIYEDTKSEKMEDEAKKYFSNFTRYMKDALVRCGFPPCPANYMASNPRWCQPLNVWKEYFSRWINNPTPEAILSSLIFFDFRPVYGNLKMAEDLRSYLKRLLKDQNIFLAIMANMVVKHRPPLGFFGKFVVDKGGEHKNELNIKISGLGPIVDITRLFAFEMGVGRTSTLGRLGALISKHGVITEFGEEIEQAFEFLMLLRLHHQFEQMQAYTEPDNFINPDKLSNLEKKTLKESFKLISKMLDLIAEHYRAGMVAQ